MEKTASLNLRVNPEVKENAEGILAKLGISMSAAINMYLMQISLVGGIPFDVKLPEAPDSVNADLMTDEELLAKLKKSYEQSLKGEVKDVDEAFAELEEKYGFRKV